MNARKLNNNETEKVTGGTLAYTISGYSVQVYFKGIREYADRNGDGYAKLIVYSDGTLYLSCEDVPLLDKRIQELGGSGLTRSSCSPYYKFVPGHDYRLVFRDDNMDVTYERIVQICGKNLSFR